MEVLSMNAELQNYIEFIQKAQAAFPKAEFNLFTSVDPKASREVVLFQKKS